MHYPSSKFVRSTAQTLAQEPVTIEDAQRSCGLGDVPYHKAALVRFIAMAREQVEKDTGIACYTGTYVRKETCWTPYYRNWFELNIRPVTAIAITYVASDGTSTTWSSAEYTLDTSGVVPIVRLNDGYSWPTLRGDINGITLTVTAGYTTVAAIPAMVKQAVLLEVARMFKLEAGEDIKNYESSYDSLAARIGREVYA